MPQKTVGVTEEEHTLFNSLVGEGTSFKGDVTVNGIFRIDGDFIGSIKTKGKVFIGRTGRAEVTIQASSIVIGGIVSGSIVSTEKVVILSSAVVMGYIKAPRLIAEEGVILEGELHITGMTKGPSPLLSKRNGSVFQRWMRGREESVQTSSIQSTVL